MELDSFISITYHRVRVICDADKACGPTGNYDFNVMSSGDTSHNLSFIESMWNNCWDELEYYDRQLYIKKNRHKDKVTVGAPAGGGRGEGVVDKSEIIRCNQKKHNEIIRTRRDISKHSPKIGVIVSQTPQTNVKCFFCFLFFVEKNCCRKSHVIHIQTIQATTTT